VQQVGTWTTLTLKWSNFYHLYYNKKKDNCKVKTKWLILFSFKWFNFLELGTYGSLIWRRQCLPVFVIFNKSSY
jgi:hypothetical protein